MAGCSKDTRASLASAMYRIRDMQSEQNCIPFYTPDVNQTIITGAYTTGTLTRPRVVRLESVETIGHTQASAFNSPVD